MRRRALRRVSAAVGAVLGALTLLAASQARTSAAVNCAPQTAWAGSETTSQHNAGTLVQIPVTEAVTVTGIAVSDAFAERSPGWAEQLLLVGLSHGPLTVGPGLLPAFTPSPAFGNLAVSSPVSHNENPYASGDVLKAAIFKTSTGSGGGMVDVPLRRDVAPGDVLWVRYDSASATPTDPEVQITVTYVQAGC